MIGCEIGFGASRNLLQCLTLCWRETHAKDGIVPQGVFVQNTWLSKLNVHVSFHDALFVCGGDEIFFGVGRHVCNEIEDRSVQFLCSETVQFVLQSAIVLSHQSMGLR